MLLFSLGLYPGIGGLWKTSILFSIVAAPIYILTSKVLRFSICTSLPTFVICRLYDDSHSDRWGDIPLWLWFAFIKWLDLHLSSDTEHLSFYVPVSHLYVFFEKMSILIFCTFFNHSCFCYWVVCVVYMFWIWIT